jgi:alpha-methylacyl-CoA racemase
LRGAHTQERGTNVLDGGAPYYAVYETADHAYVSLGPIEPKFFALLCEKLDLPRDLRDAQADRSRWPLLREAIAASIRQRTRSDWCERLEGTDVCFAPVLSLSEAPAHSHNQARQSFIEVNGVMQSAPAPRFSRTPSAIQGPSPHCAVAPQVVLERWMEKV